MHFAQVVTAAVGFALLYVVYRSLPSVHVTFVKLRQISGTDLADFTDLRILTSNASLLQSINGTWHLRQDLDNNWLYFVQVFFQPPGEPQSDRFYQLPSTFRQVRVCDYLNGVYYRELWNRHQYAIVNYPNPNTGRWICPFPRGEYHLREVPLNQGTGFLWLSRPGLYRVEFGLANAGVAKVKGVIEFRVTQMAMNGGYY